MKFEDRQKELEEKLTGLLKELGINLYAANVVMPNGEVLPVIKMSDTMGEEILKKENVKIKAKKNED